MTHFKQRRFYKQTTLRTAAFAQNSFYAHMLLRREVCNYREKLLHQVGKTLFDRTCTVAVWTCWTLFVSSSWWPTFRAPSPKLQLRLNPWSFCHHTLEVPHLSPRFFCSWDWLKVFASPMAYQKLSWVIIRQELFWRKPAFYSLFFHWYYGHGPWPEKGMVATKGIDSNGNFISRGFRWLCMRFCIAFAKWLRDVLVAGW